VLLLVFGFFNVVSRETGQIHQDIFFEQPPPPTHAGAEKKKQERRKKKKKKRFSTAQITGSRGAVT
jgi:hypothetical protein